jgi:hypothetical protein
MDEWTYLPVDESKLGPMQRKIAPERRGIPYDEWKAKELKRIFAEYRAAQSNTYEEKSNG